MFLFREFGVDVFDDTFERSEFHHCVRNLTTPEWLETFVQTRERLACFKCSEEAKQIDSERGIKNKIESDRAIMNRG